MSLDVLLSSEMDDRTALRSAHSCISNPLTSQQRKPRQPRSWCRRFARRRRMWADRTSEVRWGVPQDIQEIGTGWQSSIASNVATALGHKRGSWLSVVPITYAQNMAEGLERAKEPYLASAEQRRTGSREWPYCRGVKGIRFVRHIGGQDFGDGTAEITARVEIHVPRQGNDQRCHCKDVEGT